MEFALSEDQHLLQSSVNGVLGTVSSLDDVRKIASGETSSQAMTEALRALGTDTLLIPENYGGLGLGALDAILIQDALGGHVSPADFIANALSVQTICLSADEALKREHFAGIIDGDMRIAVALNEYVSRRDGAGITAESDRLSGKALFAIGVEQATHVLTSDRKDCIWLVPLGGSIKRTALATIDRTRQFDELVFTDAKAVLLAKEDEGQCIADQTLALARLLMAADTLGAAQTMLDKAVLYAKERKQFGRVIGSFQAVKHMCAEMAAKLEPARGLLWHAAYILDTEPVRAPLMACLAKSHLSEVGTFIARTATEVHGGMGFTDLLGLHYWFKRIGANRQLLGSPEQVRAHAAKLQGWA